MMPKLTPRMNKVIKLAQRIARDYGQEYVGTEHMLLAILAEGSGMACEILHDAGIDLRRAKGVVDKLMRSALEDTWVFGRLPGTPHFRNVIEGADRGGPALQQQRGLSRVSARRPVPRGRQRRPQRPDRDGHRCRSDPCRDRPPPRNVAGGM